MHIGYRSLQPHGMGDLFNNPLTLNESKAVMVCIDSFKLQTMTAFNQKFLQGVQGGSFFKKRPPGRRRHLGHGVFPGVSLRKERDRLKSIQ